MRFVIVIIIGMMIFVPLNTHAQGTEQIITSENVDQLDLVQTLGRGKALDAQWSPDGAWFGVLTSRGVWLYPEYDVVSEPIRVGDDSGFMSAFVFHPTEPQIITGYADGSIAVWSCPDGELLDEWASDLHNIHEIAISPDGTRLATSENIFDPWLWNESSVMLWDFEAREEIWRIANVPEPSGLVFSEDRLFTNFYSVSDGGYESIVQSWDIYSSEPTPTEIDLAACGLEISADQTMLLGVGGCAYFWFRQIDLTSDSVLNISLNRFFEDGGTMTVDADGLLLTDRGEVWWYEWGDEEATLIDIYQRRIDVISVDDVTGRFAVIDQDGYIYHYPSTISGLAGVSNHFSNGIQKILVSRAGNTIYMLEGNVFLRWDWSQKGWDFHIWDRNTESITFSLPLNSFATIAMSDNERWLVLGDTSANVYLLDLYTREQVAMLSLKANYLYPDLLLSEIAIDDCQPDYVEFRDGLNEFLTPSCATAEIFSWDISNIKPDVPPEPAIRSPNNYIPCLADSDLASRDGLIATAACNIVIADKTRVIGIFEMTASEGDSWTMSPIGSVDIEISADNRYVVTAGFDMIYHGWFGATPLWIVDLTENTIRTIDAHHKSIYAIAISPDSQLFASASADANVRLWDSDTLELVHEIPMPGGANDVQFSADGTELFIAGDDGTVRIWAVE